MKRAFALTFGVFSYACFFCSLLYTIAFVGGVFFPKGVDDGTPESLPVAIAINLGLIVLFGLQHTGMARPAFKRVFTELVPVHLERSVYVLISTVAWVGLLWQWRPVGDVVWDVQGTLLGGAMWALFGAGWLILLTASFAICHFDLFGLRQVWTYFRGRSYRAPEFRLRGHYRWVRHPLMVGWLLGFWATPTMTVGHLMFALLNSAYILVGVLCEERTLIAEHGEDYRAYKRNVPALIPFLKRRSDTRTGAPQGA